MLSTLRDPTQLRRRQCATRQMYAKIMQKGYSHALHNHIYMDYARHGEIQGRSLALGTWQKTQILIAHQKEGIDWTKKVPLAAKKSSARD